MDIVEVDLAQLRDALSPAGALGSGQLLFVVDIGATNTRLGFSRRDAKAVHVTFVKVPVNSISNLLNVFADFAKELGDPVCRRVVGAALNLPGPVQGGVGGPIANYLGSTPHDKTLFLERLPTALFPRRHTVMLNDLEAGAFGVVAAHHYGIFPEFFTALWAGTISGGGATPSTLAKGHCLIVAPGTGLGVALIQYHAAKDQFTVLPLEFGHTSVQSETETAFLQHYKQQLKRGNYAAEYDDICSGRGLVRLYRFAGGDERHTAEDISRLARSGDASALRALRTYHLFLMRFCSQMAMGFVPSTIVILGDNTVSNAFFYEQEAMVQEMKLALLDHSAERMGFMSRPSVLRQSRGGNFNLLGCLYVSQEAALVASKL